MVETLRWQNLVKILVSRGFVLTETDRRKLFKNWRHRFRKDGEELEALAHLLVVDEEAEATLDLAADLRVGRVVLDQQLLSNFDAQLKQNIGLNF